MEKTDQRWPAVQTARIASGGVTTGRLVSNAVVRGGSVTSAKIAAGPVARAVERCAYCGRRADYTQATCPGCGAPN